MERFRELINKSFRCTKSDTFVFFTKITAATWSINKIIPWGIATWPQWWSFENKSQLGVYFYSEISSKKLLTITDHQKSHQKLGIILESKLFWILQLSKNANNKKHSPKQLFFNEFLCKNLPPVVSFPQNSTTKVSWSLLHRQKRIVIYYVKKFIRKSQ